MTTLVQLIGRLGVLDRDEVIYAAEPWTPDSEAVCCAESQDGDESSDLAYFLEVDVIHDVTQTWSQWRDGREPTAEDLTEAAIHYAENDAYLPADEAGGGDGRSDPEHACGPLRTFQQRAGRAAGQRLVTTMTFAHRISSVAAGLPDRARQMSDGELRDLARRSAEWAVSRTGVQDPAIDAGLEALTSGRPSQDARIAVHKAVERLDQVAFEMQVGVDSGGASEEDYLRAFAQARAAAAVQYALADDPREAAMESMYEAQAADGSVDELLAELGLS